MENKIARLLSLTQIAMRVTVIVLISVAMFLFAACDLNAPTDQRDPNAISDKNVSNALAS